MTSNFFSLAADQVSILHSASQYKEQLLELIRNAEHRIYITALYLQDDAAGNEILQALFDAKKTNPNLIVKVFVDAHRAQRGLIGEKEQLGNRAMYQAYTKKYDLDVNIHGVAVKNKELFGVLHLKGMVFDDTVFYTGASINDVYLQQNDKYRCDRYYLLKAQGLADSFCQYLEDVFVTSGLAPKLNQDVYPQGTELKKQILKLKQTLSKSQYNISQSPLVNGEIQVEPLVGFGPRRNKLNTKIRKTIQQAEKNLVIFTPYFNFPKVVSRDIAKALKRGVKIDITVGDKTANDFYIADEEQFSTIGIVPYIYEILLVRFVKRWKKYITTGQLTVRLWQHDSNSFHLKGLIADDVHHLITGSNINPRAWSLDLENGLAMFDPNRTLMEQVNKELEHIYQHAKVIKSVDQLDNLKDYPSKPQKLLKRLRLAQIDRLLKRLL